MKQFYSVLFSLDNTNQNQNFVMDIDEITDLNTQENRMTKKLLEHVVFQPRQEVVEGIFDMIRSGKI